MSESDWMKGNRAAYDAMLHHCMGRLGSSPTAANAAKLTLELRAARDALRELCERLNVQYEWDDTLYFADAIRKVADELSER